MIDEKKPGKSGDGKDPAAGVGENPVSGAGEKKPSKKPGKSKAAQIGMTPKRAKELGLDPFPYGG